MQKKSAFTLVEISLVLIIIGILIAGIVKGSAVIQYSKLAGAKSLTEKSPVLNINNLMLWYETTSKESFNGAASTNNTTITTWYDLNTQNASQNNASSSGSTRPIYIENCINAIPCIRFDGSNDYLAFDGTSLAGSNYTIFIVEQRSSNKSENYFLGGNGGLTNGNLVLGYRNNTTITQAQYYNDMDYTVPGYVAQTPIIHTFTLNKITGKSYWRNNATTTPNSTASQLSAMIETPGIALGRFSGVFYSGDIAEFIIYNRALTSKEHRDITLYLAKKYNIKVAT
jgi:prepilin-type N-terminal cleavage/methylation domain-containing protein